MRILVVSLLILAGISVYLIRRARRDPGIQRMTIAVADIGDVYRQIADQAVETSFAVLGIQTEDDEANVEIQFSVENGVAGLDWILMSPANIAAKPTVMQYARSKGLEWQEREMNDWLYLRIEEGDLVSFCVSLISDLYQVQQVELKYGGFRYSA